MSTSRTTGSHVPRRALDRARRSMPAIALAVLVAAAAPAHAAPTQPGELTHPLVTASTCQNCHSFGNIAPHEADPLYAPFFGWQGTMMANAARDPVFWAGVAIASQDLPGGTSECIRCHSPRAFLEGRGDATAIGDLLPEDLAGGVECELCHRTIEDLATPPGNAQYQVDDVPVNGVVPRHGPWTYEGNVGNPPHEWVQDPYTGSARLCGTCHDVTTPRERVDDAGVGMGVDFNEQRTYSEWLGSAFAQAGDDFRSCQDCHMPAVDEMPGCFDNANAGLTHATGGRRHDLVGANRFMMELLRGIYGDSGSGEVSDFFYDNAIDALDAFVATAATLEATAPRSVDLGAGLSGLDVTVTNETGHKLPSGYSEGRVMWLEVIARYGDQVVWSSGTWTQGTGMETDAQLRTYRAIAEDFDDGATFHLLRNNHWVEDTRIPPRGSMPSLETDPVGDRYTLQGDGTWPHFDQVSYAFDGRDDIVDATPDVTDDDVLEVDVRLLYLINTPEYVQFLDDENSTNDAGATVRSLIEDAGGAVPLQLATAQLSIPITGFGSAGGSSSGGATSAADSSGGGGSSGGSGGSATTEASASASAGTGTGEEGSSGAGAGEGGGGDGCSCDLGTAPTGALPWLAVLVGLRRRRRT
ncbi:MAG: multiheme c-type cytochrome [Nannocystaceae bacterium]